MTTTLNAGGGANLTQNSFDRSRDLNISMVYSGAQLKGHPYLSSIQKKNNMSTRQ